MRAGLRIVGGTLFAALSGMLVAIPASMLADLVLIDDAAFEAGMAVAFLGLMALGFGFWAGGSASLMIALMFEAARRERFSKRALTMGSLATAGTWILYGIWAMQSVSSAENVMRLLAPLLQPHTAAKKPKGGEHLFRLAGCEQLVGGWGS